MRKGIDLSAATRAERAVMTAGLAVFFNTLIPWWYRIRTLHKTFLHNGGLSGWGVVAAIAGFAAAVTVVARHSSVPAAFKDRLLYLGFGALAVVALGLHAVESTRGIWIGFWVEGALALALAGAGVARVREHRRGWV